MKQNLRALDFINVVLNLKKFFQYFVVWRFSLKSLSSFLVKYRLTNNLTNG
ncbi:hypothetical protein N577_015660 [Lacticaseibacillus rhamnosus 2166]|nr:hypothetical protein N577_015660 [Lacticaseibacillus rhamnosus 2166]